MTASIQCSDIHKKKNAIDLIRLWKSDIDGKNDNKKRRETVNEDDFSNITPSAYKEGALCLSSSLLSFAGNSHTLAKSWHLLLF